MNEFEREYRYLVIKVKDARKYLDAEDQHALEEIADRIERGRIADGKEALLCVVVEHDWPEYEPTWAAIEARTSNVKWTKSVTCIVLGLSRL